MMMLLAFSSDASVQGNHFATRGAQRVSNVKAHQNFVKELAAAPAPGTVEAPEQGFEGENVQHVDMDTATGDWRREYGPKGPPHHPAADMKSNAKTTTLLVG